MKNKALIRINIIQALIFAIGICLLDSTGFWQGVSLAMVLEPMAWFGLFLLANRGRI